MKSKQVTTMPVHHRAANFLYDYPFTLVCTLGAPIIGGVLHENLKLKHLSWSSRLMQTRVYAQGGILIVLLGTMAFRDYMNTRGRFPEPNGELEEKDKFVKY